MKLSKKLANLADLLVNPDENALLIEADSYGNEVLDKVSEAFVKAAAMIKEAADYADPFTPEPEYRYVLNVQCVDGDNSKSFKFEEPSVAELKTAIENKISEFSDGSTKCSFLLEVFSKDGSEEKYSGYNLSVDKLKLELARWIAHLEEAYGQFDLVSPKEEPKEEELTEQDIDFMSSVAELATTFDSSGNASLQKYASVLDELLLTLAASQEEVARLKAQQDNKTEELKKKYNEVKEKLDTKLDAKEAVEAIKKSPYFQEYRPMEAPLSTRYSPDHPGVPVARVGESSWQDIITGKIYNYETGFITDKGVKVPGGTVAGQTDIDLRNQHTIFDDRESRVNAKATEKK